MNPLKFLVGGGNAKYVGKGGVYLRTPLFCREVEVTQKCTGNTIAKTWIIDLGEPKLVRDKVLKDTQLEAYLSIRELVPKTKDTTGLSELLNYIEEHHSEYLI